MRLLCAASRTLGLTGRLPRSGHCAHNLAKVVGRGFESHRTLGENKHLREICQTIERSSAQAFGHGLGTVWASCAGTMAVNRAIILMDVVQRNAIRRHTWLPRSIFAPWLSARNIGRRSARSLRRSGPRCCPNTASRVRPLAGGSRSATSRCAGRWNPAGGLRYRGQPLPCGTRSGMAAAVDRKRIMQRTPWCPRRGCGRQPGSTRPSSSSSITQARKPSGIEDRPMPV